MTRFEADLMVLAFYAAIALWVFLYVKRKRHASRSLWKSFGLVAGAAGLAVIIPIAVILALDAIIDLPRNTVVVSGFVGGMVIVLIRVWRWSIARIAQPLTLTASAAAAFPSNAAQ